MNNITEKRCPVDNCVLGASCKSYAMWSHSNWRSASWTKGHDLCYSK